MGPEFFASFDDPDANDNDDLEFFPVIEMIDGRLDSEIDSIRHSDPAAQRSSITHMAGLVALHVALSGDDDEKAREAAQTYCRDYDLFFVER